MRKVKRWRYYCDYCGKSGGHAYHMQQHERHCTANPNRECRMCILSKGVSTPISEIEVNLVPEHIWRNDAGYEFGYVIKDLQPLRDAVENCPACILAYLRQGNFDAEFNFKNESDVFFKNQNEEKRPAYMSSHGYV